MKQKTAAAILIPVFCAWCIGFAMGKPNFSGTWVLDKDKSFSNQPGLEQTLTIDYFIDGPRGSFESKRVFTKK